MIPFYIEQFTYNQSESNVWIDQPTYTGKIIIVNIKSRNFLILKNKNEARFVKHRLLNLLLSDYIRRGRAKLLTRLLFTFCFNSLFILNLIYDPTTYKLVANRFKPRMLLQNLEIFASFFRYIVEITI